MPSVVVVGGLNMDLMVRVRRLPRPAETVLGQPYQAQPGGKGGNQAYAAARLGAQVSLIGCVGDDAFGKALVDALHAGGVDVSAVRVVMASPTGIAMIAVDDEGQNQIVVSSGANAHLSADEVEAALGGQRGGHLLLQLESPQDAVAAAAACARQRGLTVILDPAPAQPLSRGLLAHVDILTPNEAEAATLLGRDGVSVSFEEAPGWAREIRGLGVGTVILKIGSHGAIVATARGETHHPAPAARAIDTTAAGDTFNGALAVGLSEGLRLDDAVDFANAAAALSVCRPGAQASMPSRAEVGRARS